MDLLHWELFQYMDSSSLNGQLLGSYSVVIKSYHYALLHNYVFVDQVFLPLYKKIFGILTCYKSRPSSNFK